MRSNFSIRQHTLAYVSIRQHTSAYVSVRQHTSAYVSIRQHARLHTCLELCRWSLRRRDFGIPRLAPVATLMSFFASIAISRRRRSAYIYSIRQHTSAYVSIL
jgi:hypothetical protein